MSFDSPRADRWFHRQNLVINVLCWYQFNFRSIEHHSWSTYQSSSYQVSSVKSIRFCSALLIHPELAQQFSEGYANSIYHPMKVLHMSREEGERCHEEKKLRVGVAYTCWHQRVQNLQGIILSPPASPFLRWYPVFLSTLQMNNKITANLLFPAGYRSWPKLRTAPICPFYGWYQIKMKPIFLNNEE